jgi:hypothetical protein
MVTWILGFVEPCFIGTPFKDLGYVLDETISKLLPRTQMAK